MVRFGSCLICASELVKLRFVVVLTPRDEWNYFFWLYLAFCASQLWIAVLSLVWCAWRG